MNDYLVPKLKASLIENPLKEGIIAKYSKSKVISYYLDDKIGDIEDYSKLPPD